MGTFRETRTNYSENAEIYCLHTENGAWYGMRPPSPRLIYAVIRVEIGVFRRFSAEHPDKAVIASCLSSREIMNVYFTSIKLHFHYQKITKQRPSVIAIDVVSAVLLCAHVLDDTFAKKGLPHKGSTIQDKF